MSYECDVRPDFYTYSEPRARKTYRCCECNAPIEKGEKHFFGVGKWDGYLSSYRQHFACMEACMMVRDHFQGGECLPFGSLFEWYGDNKYQSDIYDEKWRRFRSLMAKILWRRRRRNAAIKLEAQG